MPAYQKSTIGNINEFTFQADNKFHVFRMTLEAIQHIRPAFAPHARPPTPCRGRKKQHALMLKYRPHWHTV
jgi:hypothetical protein